VDRADADDLAGRDRHRLDHAAPPELAYRLAGAEELPGEV
jgi:hypothetical protein